MVSLQWQPGNWEMKLFLPSYQIYQRMDQIMSDTYLYQYVRIVISFPDVQLPLSFSYVISFSINIFGYMYHPYNRHVLYLYDPILNNNCTYTRLYYLIFQKFSCSNILEQFHQHGIKRFDFHSNGTYTSRKADNVFAHVVSINNNTMFITFIQNQFTNLFFFSIVYNTLCLPSILCLPSAG